MNTTTVTLSRNQKRLIDRYLGKAMNEMTTEKLIGALEEALSKLEPNLILLSDAYKYSHPDFYPENLTYMCSYLESRGGKFKETLFFGIQYIVKKYLVGNVLNENMINEADEKLNDVDGVFMGDKVFPKERWMRLLEKYDGAFPVMIKAVAEGTIVPVKNVLATVESVDEEFPWCGSFIEGLILQTWYPVTVATLSHEVVKIIKKYLAMTGTPQDIIDIVASFVLNDFGFRGVSSVESSSIGGAAHLMNSSGSDNIVGSDMLIKYYRAKKMHGKSIRATEHSVMTLKGEAGEIEMMERVLDKYPTGIVACVSDSYNIIRACDKYWGGILKEKVLKRDGTLVIRPDCYSDDTEILTPNGWVFFKDLTPDMLVAQVEDDGTYTFVEPTNYIKDKYKGDMYLFKDHHGKMDMLVTPNHRMIYQQFDNWKVELAENIKQKNYNKYFHRSAKAVNNNKKLSFIERLNIAFQADGSYQTGVTSAIRFSFSKKRKINRMKDLLNDNNVEYVIYPLSDGRFEFNIKIDSSLVSKNFNWVDTTTLCSNWCQEFIEEMSHWDSCIRNENKIKYDTTIEENIKIVELVALSAGYGCLLSKYVDVRKEIFNDVYTANILKNNKIGGQSITKSKIKYDGMIYCVTVPTGRLLVKRNRCTVVCGNSGDPKQTLLKIFEALFNNFGYTERSGFKLLPPQVRVIQGDGVNYNSIIDIYELLVKNGIAAENLIFGMGGKLLQADINRDTQNFAIKACYAIMGGIGYNVFKSPTEIDENGNMQVSFKKSKSGKMKLVNMNGILTTITSEHPDFDSLKDELEVIFNTGVLLIDRTSDEIIDRAKININVEDFLMVA